MSGEKVEPLSEQIAALSERIAKLEEALSSVKARPPVSVSDETKEGLLNDMILLARSGNPTMQIWLSKQWLGFKDYSTGELPAKFRRDPEKPQQA